MDYKIELPKCPECGSRNTRQIQILCEETKTINVTKYLYGVRVTRIEKKEKEAVQIIKFKCNNCGKRFRKTYIHTKIRIV